ncbi:Mitogen-activated protein kinase [Balamuthia mandrillaris]
MEGGSASRNQGEGPILQQNINFALPTLDLLEQSGELEFLNCAICYDQMEQIACILSEPDASGQVCTHNFCMDCIREHRARSDKCPICRRKILNVVINRMAMELLSHNQQERRHLKEQTNNIQTLSNQIEAAKQRLNRMIDSGSGSSAGDSSSSGAQQREDAMNALEELIGGLEEQLEAAKRQKEEETKRLLQTMESEQQRLIELEQEKENYKQKYEQMVKEQKQAEARRRAESEASHRRMVMEQQQRDEQRTNPSPSSPPSSSSYSSIFGLGKSLWTGAADYVPSVSGWSASLTSPLSYFTGWGGLYSSSTVALGPLVRKPEEYKLCERRGIRKDSPVWKAIELATNTEVAVKRVELNPSSASTSSASASPSSSSPSCAPSSTSSLDFNAYSFLGGSTTHLIFREAMLLHTLNHPNILKLKGVIKDTTMSFASSFSSSYLASSATSSSSASSSGPFYFYVLPFVKYDLEYMTSATRLNLKQIRHIIFQLVLTLNYLHSADIVHRDIKPTSLLIDAQCKIFLCSFSSARSLFCPSSSSSTKPLYLDALPSMVYLGYRAPEIILAAGHLQPTPKDWKAADVWSCGCVFGQLLMRGRPLFGGSGPDRTLKSILSLEECRDSLGEMPSRFVTLNTSVALEEEPTRSLRSLLVQTASSASSSPMSPSSSFIGSFPASPTSSFSSPPSLSTPSSPSSPSSTSSSSMEEADVYEAALDLLKHMLQFDPEARITARQALDHPFFAPFDAVRRKKKKLRHCSIPKELFTDDKIPAFLQEFCAGLI